MMAEEIEDTVQRDLSSAERKQLRGLAHSLKPVASVGKDGLSEQFIAELKSALEHHELVKVKFLEGKSEKKELAAELAEKCDAGLAGLIGNVAILYRQNPDPKKRKVKLAAALAKAQGR